MIWGFTFSLYMTKKKQRSHYHSSSPCSFLVGLSRHLFALAPIAWGHARGVHPAHRMWGIHQAPLTVAWRPPVSVLPLKSFILASQIWQGRLDSFLLLLLFVCFFNSFGHQGVRSGMGWGPGPGHVIPWCFQLDFTWSTSSHFMVLPWDLPVCECCCF